MAQLANYSKFFKTILYREEHIFKIYFKNIIKTFVLLNYTKMKDDEKLIKC